MSTFQFTPVEDDEAETAHNMHERHRARVAKEPVPVLQRGSAEARPGDSVPGRLTGAWSGGVNTQHRDHVLRLREEHALPPSLRHHTLHTIRRDIPTERIEPAPLPRAPVPLDKS